MLDLYRMKHELSMEVLIDTSLMNVGENDSKNHTPKNWNEDKIF
jgi:hypothetical protein